MKIGYERDRTGRETSGAEGRVHESGARPVSGAALQSGAVGVILVNYGSTEDTLACLDALGSLAASPRRIVVVENGTGPEAVAELRRGISAMRSSPAPELLALPENLGFAGGNNAALRLLLDDPDCRAFWLLNNDTLPMPTALEGLCHRLNGQDRPGAVGSLLLDSDDGRTVQCAAGGRLSRWFGTTQHLLEGLPVEKAETLAPGIVEKRLAYLCGASMLVTRRAVEVVGPMDAAYFLYYEDVDWGVRIRRGGFELGYAPDSRVLHREGGSTGASSRSRSGFPLRSAHVDHLSLRNRIRLMRNLFPWALPLTLLSFAGVAINRMRRGQWDRLGLVAEAVRDGLRNRGGPVRSRRS